MYIILHISCHDYTSHFPTHSGHLKSRQTALLLLFFPLLISRVREDNKSSWRARALTAKPRRWRWRSLLRQHLGRKHKNSLSHYFGKRPAFPRSPRSHSLPPSFLYGSRVPTGGLRNSAFGDVHGVMPRSHGPAFQRVPLTFPKSFLDTVVSRSFPPSPGSQAWIAFPWRSQSSSERITGGFQSRFREAGVHGNAREQTFPGVRRGHRPAFNDMLALNNFSQLGHVS